MKTPTSQLTTLFVVFASVLAAGADDASGAAIAPEGSIDFGAESPKRQYLIAPRVGRSSGPSSSSAIWTALEEAASIQSAGLQNHGLSLPVRSSLVFLVGNRRLIGPRSGGLLPTARLGRRASGSPMGLIPQARVGKRTELEAAGDQEVAIATISDASALSDALDLMIAG